MYVVIETMGIHIILLLY